MKTDKTAKKLVEKTISATDYQKAMFAQGVDRVFLAIDGVQRAFVSYSDYMTRMAVVISGQQSVLSTPFLGPGGLACLQQTKGAWDLAASLSERAAQSLSILHARVGAFALIYHEAEKDLGKDAALKILSRMDKEAKSDFSWYHEQWNTFLGWLRVAGLPCQFLPNSPKVRVSTKKFVFDDKKRTWSVDAKNTGAKANAAFPGESTSGTD